MRRAYEPTSDEVTVQPRERSLAAAMDPDDAYASLMPEELGENALRAATQSGWPPSDSDAHGLAAVAASAAPLFDSDAVLASKDVWAETVELAVEYGAWIESGRASEDFAWDEPDEPTWSRDVDLHQTKVVEASLFDAGSEETVDETRAPHVSADNDTAEHAAGSGRRVRKLRAVR
jgi:hypothetical protein